MPAEPSALARLTRLLGEMQREGEALRRLHSELAGVRAAWPQDGAPARPDLLVAAVDLHGYYTALEALLERVARTVDEEVPAGPAWHAELLTQMSLEIPSLRPPVIPDHAVTDLHELRKFRHFFRNAYVLDPDPARVLEQVDRVLRIHPTTAAMIDGLRLHLEQVLEALARER